MNLTKMSIEELYSLLFSDSIKTDESHYSVIVELINNGETVSDLIERTDEFIQVRSKMANCNNQFTI